MDATDGPRIVLVHDWLTGMRGGEKCLEVLCSEYPHAPLLSLLHLPGSVAPTIENRKIYTSWLQRLPSSGRYYRYLLPLMPSAANWRVPRCDLVLSFSHCVAKAAQPPAGVPHICYCFTPMRYAWHLRDSYFDRARGWGPGRAALDLLLQRLRDWDRRTAQGVTQFIAISRTVQERIAECYGRSSTIIYPPVDTEFYTPAAVPREDFYLAVSALAPYKRLDLAIAGCRRLGRELVIIGAGPEHRKLAALAGGGVQLLGWQPNEVIRNRLRRCRALLFPGEEDFGIVPLEAQACGTPVIAFGRGGATETVIPPGGRREPTGLWFEEQTVDGLCTAILRFEAGSHAFSPTVARRQALRFSTARYRDEMLTYIQNVFEPSRAESRRAA